MNNDINESLAQSLDMLEGDFGGNVPSAFIFCSGAGIYFNQDGKQMPDLQILGLSGLHLFVKIYPEAPVYWSIWHKEAQRIPKDCLETLLKYIKTDVKLLYRTEGGKE